MLFICCLPNRCFSLPWLALRRSSLFFSSRPIALCPDLIYPTLLWCTALLCATLIYPALLYYTSTSAATPASTSTSKYIYIYTLPCSPPAICYPHLPFSAPRWPDLLCSAPPPRRPAQPFYIPFAFAPPFSTQPPRTPIVAGRRCSTLFVPTLSDPPLLCFLPALFDPALLNPTQFY